MTKAHNPTKPAQERHGWLVLRACLEYQTAPYPASMLLQAVALGAVVFAFLVML